MGRPSDVARAAGIDWQRLREDLAAWLERRFRPGIDCANIAGDAVELALRTFGCEPDESPGRIWRWLCRTAVNRVYLDHRRARRCTLEFTNEVDIAAKALGDYLEVASPLVEQMLAMTHGIDHQVLQMLRAGSPTNRQMAATLGVEVRTIERARSSLRRKFGALLANRSKDVGLEHL